MRKIDLMAYCNCAEILDKSGKEYPRIPVWHNCDYIKKRNKLIPQALAYAEANTTNPYQFTQAFSNKMDALAKEAKLV